MAETRAAEVTRPFTAPPLRSHIVMTSRPQNLAPSLSGGTRRAREEHIPLQDGGLPT